MLVVCHEDFKKNHQQLQQATWHKTILESEPRRSPRLLFDTIATTDENANSQEEALMPEAVSEHINGNSHTTETIQALHDVVDVDKDNEPAPKNYTTIN